MSTTTSHAGAWSLSSATAGMPEAVNFLQGQMGPLGQQGLVRLDPGSGECRTRSKPEPCFSRDEKACQADTTCEWTPGPLRCPACRGPDCRCLPQPSNSGGCHSKEK